MKYCRRSPYTDFPVPSNANTEALEYCFDSPDGSQHRMLMQGTSPVEGALSRICLQGPFSMRASKMRHLTAYLGMIPCSNGAEFFSNPQSIKASPLNYAAHRPLHAEPKISPIRVHMRKLHPVEYVQMAQLGTTANAFSRGLMDPGLFWWQVLVYYNSYQFAAVASKHNWARS